jgi:hypothetical protein
MIKGYIKKAGKTLANLQLAITLLFIIGLIIAVGTIVEQDQALTFYKNNYPELNPLFGFLTWKVIIFLSLDRIYTSWYFVLVLILFGSSLLACTFTTQLPSIKLFKIWKFYTKPTQVSNLSISENIKLKFFNSVPYQFNNNNYHFFRQQKKKLCLFRFIRPSCSCCSSFKYYYFTSRVEYRFLRWLYCPTTNTKGRANPYPKRYKIWEI